MLHLAEWCALIVRSLRFHLLSRAFLDLCLRILVYVFNDKSKFMVRNDKTRDTRSNMCLCYGD